MLVYFLLIKKTVCIYRVRPYVPIFRRLLQKLVNFLRNKKVAALSGIAQPGSFENSLKEMGAELVYPKRFADHHRFTQQELLNTINRAKKRQAEKQQNDFLCIFP